jgi:hypothetical protein
MILYIIYYYNVILQHRRFICGPSLTETSSCDAYLYTCCPVWTDTPLIKRPFVSSMLHLFHKHLFCDCVCNVINSGLFGLIETLNIMHYHCSILYVAILIALFICFPFVTGKKVLFSMELENVTSDRHT